MSTFSELDTPETTPETLAPTRPLYWSIQRELWENRAIYLAPLVVAMVFLFGYLLSTFTLPRRLRAASALDAARQHDAIDAPYSAVALLIIVTAFLVGVFYCLDALHGERRDRSILFWKSMPVSDRTAVLSKASIPMVVLPALIFVLIVATQLNMLLFSTGVVLRRGPSVQLLWSNVRFFPSSLALLYGIVVIALWHAPVYAWLLLISAWARRAAFLWAVLPLLAASAFEKVVFNSTNLARFIGYRLVGWFHEGFVFPPKGTKVAVHPLDYLTPGNFLTRPGLWLGLLFAAACIAAAVRLRRNREPI